MDPRQLLSEHVEDVRSIVRAVAFHHGLGGASVEDLESAVWIRLVEHDYRAIRQFRGEASFRTFLRVVVARLLLDMRASAWGRWRPSALAKSLGGAAPRFELLLFRDGHTVDEALAILASEGLTISAGAARAIAESLRSTPRRFVPIDHAPEVPMIDRTPEAAVDRPHRARRARVLSTALRHALEALTPADRRLLQLRHGKGLKVAAIARMLEQDQGRLYRRLSGLHRSMRRRIEEAGIKFDDVRELISA